MAKHGKHKRMMSDKEMRKMMRERAREMKEMERGGEMDQAMAEVTKRKKKRMMV